MEFIGRVPWYLLQSVRIRHPRTNLLHLTRRELSSVQTTDSDTNTFSSPPPKLMTFRTNETDPSKHGPQHEGRLYKIPDDVYEGVFQLGGFRQIHKDMFKLLNEKCIMVRKPALEVIDYLNRSDFSRPVNRYILYGKYGYGKTFTLNHILHYVYRQNFLLVHVDYSSCRWIFRPAEFTQSDTRPGRIDLPLDSAIWLQQFRAQNAHLLLKLDLRSSQKYTWSLREATEKGDKLTDIIEHGIHRIKHASDCVAVLIKELKEHANSGKFKMFVAVDCVNSFYRKPNMRLPDLSYADVDDITIVRTFKKLFRNNWKNGAVVAVVDNWPFIKRLKRIRSSRYWKNKEWEDLPRNLLTEQGFQDFDPFIPIRVDKFSEKEIESYLDYFVDRSFLTRPEALTEHGRQELKFMSAYNPRDLYELCRSV